MTASGDIEGVVGGAGDDVLVGSPGADELHGGPGKDWLRGGRGSDMLDGGEDDDRLRGERGDDLLIELGYDGVARGSDDFHGGPGADNMLSADGGADHVRCDVTDFPVQSDRFDRVDNCGWVAGWGLSNFQMRTDPELTADTVRFAITCSTVDRCRGELRLLGPGDTDYGRTSFVYERRGAGTLQFVTVPLTEAGREAIARGEVVQVEATSDEPEAPYLASAGYRRFMKLG